MKYFNWLSPLQESGIFYKNPENISKTSPKSVLALALGGTLYMPANRQDFLELVTGKKHPEIGSMVICLEDAIGDEEVKLAEQNVIQQLKKIYQSVDQDECFPFLFIRVRTPEQMKFVAKQLGEAADLLTGFVFPKLSSDNVDEYFSSLIVITQELNITLYGMPILETADLLDKRTREARFNHLSERFGAYQDFLLNLRIGATDLCGLYGIRRKYNTTIYDISIIRDFMADVINYFARDFVISGPVWEYFGQSSRVLKPELRKTPFFEDYGEEGLVYRSQLLSEHADGLIKETILDIENGLNGKTIIHPSHLGIVQSLYVVTKEEYMDALSIVSQSSEHSGAVRSAFSNKMNEIKPHSRWAEKIIAKSKIYGVYHEKHSYIDLLTKQRDLYDHEQHEGRITDQR
ncbi:HpcH/HpaI aldolase/citrate lyase family protein [Halobacillus rhizosphaerae]|uniref:HpcH/HpaI aldolase/citrate lyase family protein n=1 Tax=Halobacillus rhizosphaerae TaxID=3064889 RepID=UPI00398A8BFE